MHTTSTDPDGPRKWCAVCGYVVTAHPSAQGDATCPRCGSLLWFRGVPSREVSDACARLLELGATVRRDRSSHSWEIDLSGTRLQDHQLGCLWPLRRISELLLTDTAVTDAAMPLIREFESLEVLELGNTRITDASLRSIGQLRRLELLGLFETAVTDAGLRQLRDLSALWGLDLDDTRITGGGLASLNSLTNLEWLFLSRTGITDGHLPHLYHFPRLEELTLVDTPVTADAVWRLRQELRNCRVET